MAPPKEPSKPPPPPLSPALSDDEDDGGAEDAASSGPASSESPHSKTNLADDGEDDEEEDEEEDGGAGESTDDDDGDTPGKFTVKPSAPVSKHAAVKFDDAVSGSESPSPPSSPRKFVKPLNSKPMDPKPEVKSKKQGGTKRPAEAPTEDAGHTPKKQLIQRVWSDEDEMTILHGMVEYKNKGKDPVGDLQGFYRFIRKSLQLECTHVQLTSKVRVLRNKYQNYLKRASQGKQRAPVKPKDKLVLELSEQIWGSKSGGKSDEEDAEEEEEKANAKGASKVSNGKVGSRKKADKGTGAGQNIEQVVGLPAVESTVAASPAAPAAPAAKPVLGGGGEQSWMMEDLCIKGVGVSEELVRKGVSLMDNRVVNEYEEKWRTVKMMDMELQMKRAELVMIEMELEMKKAELVKGHIGAIREALKSGSKSGKR